MYKLIGLLLLTLSSFSLAEGYTGNEVLYTGIYFDDFQSSVMQYRRYQDGFFVDLELFDNQKINAGIGYQHLDKSTVLDIRVNKNNTKLFISKRF